MGCGHRRNVVKLKLVEGNDVGGLNQANNLLVLLALLVVLVLVAALLLLATALLLLLLSQAELLNQLRDFVGVHEVVEDGARNLQLLDAVGQGDLGGGGAPGHALDLDLLHQPQHLVEVGVDAGGLDVDDQGRLRGLALLALAGLHRLHLLLHGVVLLLVVVAEEVNVVGLLLRDRERALGEVGGGPLRPGGDVAVPPGSVRELGGVGRLAELLEDGEVVGGRGLHAGNEAVEREVLVQVGEPLGGRDGVDVDFQISHCVRVSGKSAR
ncbi:uncharacterized protein BcabD6B2_48840 [Babesia caballi]|uniref:Uncharacterized protein n=1 Tax=Babesia caballi TaxID=5871 RepID=A0AAV4M093_BABCB|nr:hypothetical protein, conserved [Babesia caballi]